MKEITTHEISMYILEDFFSLRFVYQLVRSFGVLVATHPAY